MRRPAAAAAFVVSALALAAPGAASAGSVHLEQFVSTGGTVQVSVVVRKAASFSVLLRTRTVGRTQLFLIGKRAPKGGPLLDTATTHCDGAAGSYYCKGSFEPLPAGTYTFRVVRPSGFGTHIELTVRW
ncbi:MAG TPA: hypothetical protein VFG57_05810 [Gaiella sp.]|jgi:hypothetical protein|nr:hypothetical protein [Gaiella sp.]